jgi:hypothetical protein
MAAMSEILTACLAAEEANVRAFLTGQGQLYVATYRPFDDDVISFSSWEPPNINAIGGVNKKGTKVLIHTRA